MTDARQRTLSDGKPVTADHRTIDPSTGMQRGYVVLSADERAKGFVEPVRLSYVHEKCGAVTTMGVTIAETYARDPEFYDGTFCVRCRAHFPIGAQGEFVWKGTSQKVGTRQKEQMSWKPDIVLYHGGCNDGFGAAWACWKKWGSSVDGSGDYAARIEYVPMGYGQPIPVSIKGLNVLFVDFSLKRDAMIEAAKEAKSIVVLDHHKTAEAELEPFYRVKDEWAADHVIDELLSAISKPRTDGIVFAAPNVIARFDMEKSGARLAWEFCFPGVEVPMPIQYIEDRDLWRFALENTHHFTKALSSYPQTLEEWDALFMRSIHELVGDGMAIARYHDKMVADACQNAQEVVIAGHRVMAVNVPYFLGSDCAEFLLKKYDGSHNLNRHRIDFAAYWFKRGDGTVQWGLRSEDSRLDCSEIAKKFGGGGHRNASGFTVPGA